MFQQQHLKDVFDQFQEVKDRRRDSGLNNTSPFPLLHPSLVSPDIMELGRDGSSKFTMSLMKTQALSTEMGRFQIVTQIPLMEPSRVVRPKPRKALASPDPPFFQ